MGTRKRDLTYRWISPTVRGIDMNIRPPSEQLLLSEYRVGHRRNSIESIAAAVDEALQFDNVGADTSDTSGQHRQGLQVTNVTYLDRHDNYSCTRPGISSTMTLSTGEFYKLRKWEKEPCAEASGAKPSAVRLGNGKRSELHVAPSCCIQNSLSARTKSMRTVGV